jgi:Flp pilus assembly protein TadG
MIKTLYRFLGATDAVAAVEAAIFTPIFMLLTLGIADLGAGMGVGMQVNAAAQAGATYAVVYCTASNWSTCQPSVYSAMNNATGNASFCTAVCSASFTTCADPNGGTCFTVTANYPYSPFLPTAVYPWAQSQNYSSTVTVRVQ